MDPSMNNPHVIKGSTVYINTVEEQKEEKEEG